MEMSIVPAMTRRTNRETVFDMQTAHSATRKRLTLFARVFAKINILPVEQGGHWLYTGSLCKNGYPKIRDGARFLLVHRLTLAWRTGNNGVGLDACHDDQRECPRHCVNPEHLSWKTHHENMRDVINKHGRICTNRNRATRPLFERIPF
jgi:hypothetical protein